MEGRKQAVSIRLGAADLRNVKKLSRRLGVRYSDVIRFAVRSSLARLAPLVDPAAKGRDLLPVFLESGGDMVRYLDLDASSIEAIINTDAEPASRVAYGDIQLLVYAGVSRPYAKLRLSQAQGRPLPGELTETADELNGEQSLSRYFYQKYAAEPHALPRAAGELEPQS